jgi:hypothetical protein
MTRLLVIGTIAIAAAGYVAWREGALQNEHRTKTVACVRQGFPVRGALVPDLIPGWRDRYRQMTLLISRSGKKRSSPPVRITSSTGLAGIDQAAVVRSRSLTVIVHGRATGRPSIVVGWTQRGHVTELVRTLNLIRGSAAETFALPSSENPRTLTVAVVQVQRRAIFEIDRVELRADGRQLLRNPGLKPVLCSPRAREQPGIPSTAAVEETCLRSRSASSDPRFVRVIVPNWRDRYEEMNLLAPRLSNASAPLRITSTQGLSGIDQIALLPRAPARLEVEGRILSGAAEAVISWSELGRVREITIRLRLRRGSETHRLRLPRETGPLALTVGVVQLRRHGVLELNRVGLESGRRQYLHNAALSFEDCPPLPRRPYAAFATPIWVRWSASVLLLALIGVGIWLWRGSAGPSSE